MAGRREVTTRDRQRNSAARKKTHKATLERQREQADTIQRLWNQAKTQAKAGQ